MDTSKIIKGAVSSGRYTVTAPIVKEDYGLYLQIEGVELPQTYEVDFSNSENSGTSVTMIGNSDGVLIPSQFISSGKDVFAFLYHVGADFGRTVYKFRIPNKVRPDRTDDTPTPEQASVIDQAISALNEAVEQTAQDVIDADASAQSAKEDADRAERAKEDASTFAQRSANSAQVSADYSASAQASASASAQSASEAEAARQATTSLVAEAQGYADASAQSAQASAQSASQALSSAQSASASAQSASGYASNAQSSAQTASSKASEASQSASQASGYAQTAETAKTDAQTAKTQAETARDEAVTAKTAAETAQAAAESVAESIPSDYSQLSEDVSDLKEGLSDLNAELGYSQITGVIPDGYKGIYYENSSHTVKIAYANDVFTFKRKWLNAESVSAGRLAINDSHLSLTIDDALSVKLTTNTNLELRYKTSATDNYDKFSLELKAYNADYTGSKTVYVPFISGAETLNRLNIDDFVADNNIDISVYSNLVIYGLRCKGRTTVANETAKIDVIGYADAGGDVPQTIVERVYSLEYGLSRQEETIEGLEQQTGTVKGRVSDVENLLLMNETEPAKEINLTSPNSGYLMDNGRIVNDTNYGYTDLLKVVGGAEYNFNALIFGNLALCWYDSTGSYISGVSGSTLGGTQSTALSFTLTAPDNASYVRISHKVDASKAFTMQQITDVDTSNIIERNSEKLNQLDVLPNLTDAEVYFACGDSITHANHNGISLIDLEDPFMPIGGTEGYVYNTKNYAYYIAKRHCMKWYNFGIGGTTLTQCSVAGDDKKGFATPNGRYTQLADGVTPDYITIFFGWNDKTHGPIQQREIWLKNEYGSTIYYPQTASKIGTTGYATQAQYDACNAVTGEVGGVTYNNNDEYFYAKFIGTISDTDPRTWYGAWNTVLSYLMQKYPLAKILPIVPYSSVQDENSVLGINMMMKQAVRNVSKKWGLAYFDFDSDEHQEFLATNTTPIGNYANVKAYRKEYLLADAVHPSNGGYRYMANMIGSKIMSV